jgi:predicted GTPase
MGAAGRDFHNFNVHFRDNPDYEIVAFTAAQIPNIDGRRYPPELAGDRYPNGIPIESENDVERPSNRRTTSNDSFVTSALTSPCCATAICRMTPS